VRFYHHLGNYREFPIMILGSWLFRKKSLSDQKKSRLLGEPLMEFPKRHASPCWDLAWFDMDGKRCRSTKLLTVKKSFEYERILANGFCFWCPGMVLILDHYPVAIDSSAGPSWESDTCILIIEWGFYYFVTGMGKLKLISRNLSRDFSRLSSDQFSPTWSHTQRR